MGRPLRRRHLEGLGDEAHDRGGRAPRRGDPSVSRRSPGRTSFEAITLERGVTHDIDFEQWANKVWNYGAGLGAEVSLRDFRKDLVIDFFNGPASLRSPTASSGPGCRNIRRCPNLTPMPTPSPSSPSLENGGWERDYDVGEPAESRSLSPPSEPWRGDTMPDDAGLLIFTSKGG